MRSAPRFCASDIWLEPKALHAATVRLMQSVRTTFADILLLSLRRLRNEARPAFVPRRGPWARGDSHLRRAAEPLDRKRHGHAAGPLEGEGDIHRLALLERAL